MTASDLTDLASEKAALSGVLLEPSALDAVREVVAAEHFASPSHRLVFEAFVAMSADGVPLDLTTLAARLAREGKLDAVGGPLALGEIADYAATAANVAHHALTIRLGSYDREIVAAARRVADDPGDESAFARLAELRAERSALATGTRASRAEIVCVADVVTEAVAWLWPGRVALGKLTGVIGDGGLGKSTFTLDLSARVSTGAPMPDGSPGVEGGVVILSVEDGLADTIRPRLEAAGADLSRIVALAGVRDSRGSLRIPTIDDLDALGEAIARVDARLVILDPLMALLPSRSDSYRDQDVRTVLAPLAQLAERTRCAAVIVAHNNKSRGVKAQHRAGGSVGIVNAMRSAFVVAPDPEDAERRVLACFKSNLAAKPPSLAFRLVEAANGVAHVEWVGESKHSADALLAASDAAVEASSEQSALAEARDFLRAALSRGPRPVLDVEAEARSFGIAAGTLRRARKGVVERRKPAFSGGWVLALLEGAHEDPKALNPEVCAPSASLSAFAREEF
jgi:hypothetical protein